MTIKDTKTGEEKDLPVNGLFYAIGMCPAHASSGKIRFSTDLAGHEPATSLIKSQIMVDADGYVRTIPGTAQTSVKGVFAAGDVQDKKYRQAITSAGSGCMAALEAERLISEEEAEDDAIPSTEVHVPANGYLGADKE